MAFDPIPGQIITIDEASYTFSEHPSAPGMPYGQEGRAAIVYRLQSEHGFKALKVFKPLFSIPSLVSQAEAIAQYAHLPGLQVCNRIVLTPSKHEKLLRQFPDLTYSILMPWVEGVTWQETLLNRSVLSPTQSLALARGFTKSLLAMEERGVAHCDLSGPNLLFHFNTAEHPLNDLTAAVSLVDVEGMYAPGLPQPEFLPSGSAGYAHKTAISGLFNRQADRFAGAILIAEMLAASSQVLLQSAYGENYFSPNEVQKNCARFQKLTDFLYTTWGSAVAKLFEQAWRSETLSECPTFGKWLISLPSESPEIKTDFPIINNSSAVQTLITLGNDLQMKNDSTGAIEAYQKAKALCTPGSTEYAEICSLINQAEQANRFIPDDLPKNLPGIEPVSPFSNLGKEKNKPDANPDLDQPESTKKRRLHWGIGLLFLFFLTFAGIEILTGINGKGLLSCLAAPTYTNTPTKTNAPTITLTLTRTSTATLTPTNTKTLIHTPAKTQTSSITTTSTSTIIPTTTRKPTIEGVEFKIINSCPFSYWLLIPGLFAGPISPNSEKIILVQAGYQLKYGIRGMDTNFSTGNFYIIWDGKPIVMNGDTGYCP